MNRQSLTTVQSFFLTYSLISNCAIVDCWQLSSPALSPLPLRTCRLERRRAVFGVGADARGAGMQPHRYSPQLQKRTGVNSTKYPDTKYI